MKIWLTDEEGDNRPWADLYETVTGWHQEIVGEVAKWEISHVKKGRLFAACFIREVGGALSVVDEELGSLVLPSVKDYKRGKVTAKAYADVREELAMALSESVIKRIEGLVMPKIRPSVGESRPSGAVSEPSFTPLTNGIAAPAQMPPS